MASQYLNNETIIAFLSGLFTFLGLIATGILRLLGEARKAKHAAQEAKSEATEARKNTVSVGNGFVNRMDTKLNTILERQTQLDMAIREHLEWHLKRTGEG